MLARLPLTPSDEAVELIASEHGWQDEFMVVSRASLPIQSTRLRPPVGNHEVPNMFRQQMERQGSGNAPAPVAPPVPAPTPMLPPPPRPRAAALRTPVRNGVATPDAVVTTPPPATVSKSPPPQPPVAGSPVAAAAGSPVAAAVGSPVAAAVGSPESELFQKYKFRIACDFQMPNASDQELFDAIEERLTSWRIKGGLAKKSRWFSWNEQAASGLQEFWTSRMILEFYLGPGCGVPEDVSSDRSFASRFKEGSGLKVLYYCFSEDCYRDAWSIFLIQSPLWQYYSEQLHFVKSPDDGLAEVLRLSTEWQSDKHLIELAKIVGANNFSNLSWLVEDLTGQAEQNDFADKFFGYLLHCLGQRCATLTKHATPPFSWANALSSERELQQAAVNKMRLDWRRLLLLECSAAHSADQLAEDLRVTLGTPERLLAQVLESVSWNASRAPQAMELLKLLVGGFADSKIVEDCHQKLRTATNTKANEQLRGSTVQSVLEASDVFEKRHIPHHCHFNSRDDFVSLWGSTAVDFKPRVDFKAGLHRLPKEFSAILGPKTWHTISEIELEKSAAAWAWSADDESRFIIVLRTQRWAAITWELEMIDGRVCFFRLAPHGCEFTFIYALQAWRAIPCSVKWIPDGLGIVLQQLGEPEPMPRNCLRFSNNLTYKDLQRIAADSGLDPKSRSRADLLHELANFLGDEDFAKTIVEQDKKSAKQAANGGEAALISCLYEHLDDDEKKAFGSMKEAVDKSRKAAVQKKWQKLLQEKTDEDKEGSGDDGGQDAQCGTVGDEALPCPDDQVGGTSEAGDDRQDPQMLAWCKQVMEPPADSDHDEPMLPNPIASEPSSGSACAAPPPPNPAGVDPPASQASEPASGSAGAARSSGPKIHSTPDILRKLEPCDMFKVRLSFNDHRFKCETHPSANDDRWIGSFRFKSFSKGFKISRDWEGALKEVHRHMWEKFNLSRDRYPLSSGVSEQKAGEVPADVLRDLKPIVDSMPEAKVY
eukprot:Skav225500  [mRNA]  locus=scaffold1721:99299:106847:+ [translate_table: standard]